MNFVLRMVFARMLIFISIFCLALVACKEKQSERKKVTPDMLIEMNRKMLKVEAEVIEKYIADKGLDMHKSGTGYYYQIIESFQGDTIQMNDQVTLAYTTQLLDGTICYSSATDGLLTLTVGKAQVESGLEQFVQKLGKGAVAKLILPPNLAHGIAGDGNKIPKLSIIVIDMEVVEVISGPKQ